MSQPFEGFEPANTTPVPDILFDELLIELTGAELKVLLYIIRRTRGFKKENDAISLSQFTDGITTKDGKVLDKGCGIKRRETICDALVSLEKKGYITSQKRTDPQGDKATTVYGIHFKEVVSKPDYPSTKGSFKTGLPVVSKPDQGSPVSGPGVVSKPDLQETVIQETVKQERTPTPVLSIVPSFSEQKPLLDTPLAEPLMVGKWDCEKVVQYAEYRNDRRYAKKMREAQLTAAKSLFAGDSSLTLEQFKLAFDERFDDWWIEHKKMLHVTDLKAKEQSSGLIRLYVMLDRIENNKRRKNPRNLSTQQSAEPKHTTPRVPKTDDELYRGIV